MGGRTALTRVDDHHPVQSPPDVHGERRGMTVVRMNPHRPGLDLVDELSSGRNRLPAVHRRSMPAVQVETVRMFGEVAEPNPQDVTGPGSNQGSRYPTAVHPCVDDRSRTDFDLLGGHVEFVRRESRRTTPPGLRGLPSCPPRPDTSHPYRPKRVSHLFQPRRRCYPARSHAGTRVGSGKDPGAAAQTTPPTNAPVTKMIK